MAGSEFDNEPLYESLDTIRLLRLPWGKGASKFDGYLVSFALNSASCPDFVALSYTWGGPPTHSKSINLNGHKFDVLDSLYPFLKLVPDLPEFSAETWWWIDSICINQKDEKEKSSQMEIMGTIYQRAYKTVVWLGEEVCENFGEDTRDCRGAIDNLYQLCDKIDDATRKDYSMDKAKLYALREPGSDIDWKAIERLLLRPWWRRVWTLQEFLISNHLRFYCGKKNISRQNLQDAVYATWACKGWDGHLMSRKAFWAAWGRRRINQWYEKRKHEMGLIAMMAYVGDCAATDERDRIYSLLGVAKDADMIRPLDPNSTVGEVYTELVTNFISNYNSLDIICYAHLFNNPGMSSSAKKLPSWVPDWRAHVEGKVTPVMASQGSKAGTGNFRPAWVHESEAIYRASGEIGPRFRLSDDLTMLTCDGIILDKVDGLGGSTHTDVRRVSNDQERAELSMVPSSCQENSHVNLGSISVSELMEIISRCTALDRSDRYLAGKIAPDYFRADFETFCKTMLEKPEIVPEWFREWFPINKNLSIRGQTLEAYCRALHRPVTLPTREDFRDPQNSLKWFYGRFEDTVNTMARRLAVTENGYLGMAACRAMKGDLVCVLFGCSIPVLLREREEGRYEFVGECYLDGFMNGEALDKDRGLAETQFALV